MKRLILLLLFFILYPLSFSYAAPTFDARTVATDAAVSTFSFNHTIGGGCTNNIVIVGAGDLNTTPNATITGVTVESFTATSIIGITSTVSSGYDQRAELFYRLGATTGTAIAITTNYADLSNVVTTSARSYCGVSQTTPVGTGVSSSGSSTTPSVNATSASGELVVDLTLVSYWPNGTASITVGAGQTQRTNDTTWGCPTDTYYCFGESEKTGASSVTMSWTADVSADWEIVAVGLKPFTTVTARRRAVIMQ